LRCLFAVGETNLELVQPTADDTGVARFLGKRGRAPPHLPRVDDIEAARTASKANGVHDRQGYTTRGSRTGGFVHPKGMHGVMLELVEPPHQNSAG